MTVTSTSPRPIAVVSFVRGDLVTPKPPPATETGLVGWARKQLFATIGDTILTIVSVLVIGGILWTVADFALVRAIYSANSGAECRIANAGACWPYVAAFWRVFLYGRYPLEEQYRCNIVFALFIVLLIPLLVPRAPFKRLNALLFFLVLPVAAAILLSGGLFDLPVVEAQLWGGLLITLIVAVTGIVASFPLGLLLALGRRSKLPLIQSLSVIYIELWRGVPLITVLFMAAHMLPLAVPNGWKVNSLFSALVGVMLFTAAYLAEIIRGGLQSIPKGQTEGAQALGLGYWQTTGLIILPQAIKVVIPNIVSSFIALFKDTTLVLTISIYDLLGEIQQTAKGAEWTAPSISTTGYLVAALIFWAFCFSMSRYSQFLERRLNTGHKR